MENGGNKKVNDIFEARLDSSSQSSIKPTTSATGPVRERFIRDKYERRKYYDATVLARYLSNDLQPTSSSSEDDSSSEDEPSNSNRKTSAKSSNKTTATIRIPSQAAKLRAEARRSRNANPHSNSNSTITSNKKILVTIAI